MENKIITKQELDGLFNKIIKDNNIVISDLITEDGHDEYSPKIEAIMTIDGFDGTFKVFDSGSGGGFDISGLHGEDFYLFIRRQIKDIPKVDFDGVVASVDAGDFLDYIMEMSEQKLTCENYVLIYAKKSPNAPIEIITIEAKGESKYNAETAETWNVAIGNKYGNDYCSVEIVNKKFI